MGSGKTTVAKELAESTGYTFVDLDDLIQQRSGYSVEQIFSFFGEDRFRELETSALHNTFGKSNVVVATGGGAPCFYDNIELMKENGQVFYLSLTAEELSQRLIKDKENNRPLLLSKPEEGLSEFIKTHLDKRMPFYKCAHHIIDGSQGVETIIRAINDLLSTQK